LATLLSKILVTSFMVNFLEREEPSIYGYGYAPRYRSELVANQGELCENITIAFTLSKKTFIHHAL